MLRNDPLHFCDMAENFKLISPRIHHESERVSGFCARKHRCMRNLQRREEYRKHPLRKKKIAARNRGALLGGRHEDLEQALWLLHPGGVPRAGPITFGFSCEK